MSPAWVMNVVVVAVSCPPFISLKCTGVAHSYSHFLCLHLKFCEVWGGSGSHCRTGKHLFDDRSFPPKMLSLNSHAFNGWEKMKAGKPFCCFGNRFNTASGTFQTLMFEGVGMAGGGRPSVGKYFHHFESRLSLGRRRGVSSSHLLATGETTSR